jgi:polar amino acid transport system substrate-binding protein
VASGEEAKQCFLDGEADVLAGVKAPLLGFVAAHAGLRVLPGRFMQIDQAMGVPKGRPRAFAFLRDFVEDVKAAGFVRDALDRTGQHDAVVAQAVAK